MKTFLALFLPTALLSLWTLSVLGAPPLLQAGPMIGHVSDSEASIWVRAKQGSSVSGTARQDAKVVKHTGITDLDDGFYLVHFTGLAPGTATKVTLEATKPGKGAAEKQVTREQVSFRTAPAPSQTGKVRIAFGSCSKLSQYDSAPIYHCIAKEQPDCAIFLGDNAYFIVADGSDRHFSTTGPRGDWNFEEAMTARHLVTRVSRDLQPMMRSVPSYGIWDDHDYGPDNEDREFELKEEALRAFRQMWANPGWGTKEVPGIFSKFRHGPVEVFLMDDRYYKYSPQRYKDVTVDTGEIWGVAQTQWLLDGLKASTAPVKLIANGTQVLSSGMRGEGHFQEARNERQRVLDFVAKHEIGGVVFISGDRHYSEAMQLRQPDGTIVVEGTSSPLQQDQEVSYFPRTHATQLWSMFGNNFGLITVDIPEEGKGTVRFETRDETNAVPVLYGEPRATTWTLDQLDYGGDEAVPPTWTPIFDGETLEGWTQKNGTASYRVEKGVMIGKTADGSPNSFLCTEKEFADFELMFDVLVDDALNSGVQIRSESYPDFKDGRVHGPQIEIESSPGNAGYVYSEGTGQGWMSQKRHKNAFRNGVWNHFYVRAVGSRIQTWINGVAVADLSEDEMSPSGFIGLQVHGIARGSGPYEVRWRNLHVKELKAPESKG
jgi:hypothetical protein